MKTHVEFHKDVYLNLSKFDKCLYDFISKRSPACMMLCPFIGFGLFLTLAIHWYILPISILGLFLISMYIVNIFYKVVSITYYCDKCGGETEFAGLSGNYHNTDSCYECKECGHKHFI